MSYKWIRTDEVVKRLEDGVCIPNDGMNRDWRKYQEWVSGGGITEAAEIPGPPIDLSNIDNLDKVLKSLGLLLRQYTNSLQAGTHSQKTVAQLKSDFAQIYTNLP
jgi:hypothetical protein